MLKEKLNELKNAENEAQNIVEEAQRRADMIMRGADEKKAEIANRAKIEFKDTVEAEMAKTAPKIQAEKEEIERKGDEMAEAVKKSSRGRIPQAVHTLVSRVTEGFLE